MNILNIAINKGYNTKDMDTLFDFYYNDVMMGIIKPFFESFDNVSYIETIKLENSDYKKRVIFDIGLENIALFFDIKVDSVTSYDIVYVGVCRKDNATTSLYKWTIHIVGTHDYNSTNRVYEFIMDKNIFVISKNNNLVAVHCVYNSGNVPNASPFFILDTDNFGNKFVFIGGNNSSTNELYYDNNNTYYKHTVDATHVSNAMDGKVWLSNTTIFLDNSLKATTTGLLKICHSSLGTNSGLSGTLIDVEGTRYRKLNYCWWIEDNE